MEQKQEMVTEALVLVLAKLRKCRKLSVKLVKELENQW